jgi:hypothetical protein
MHLSIKLKCTLFLVSFIAKGESIKTKAIIEDRIYYLDSDFRF